MTRSARRPTQTHASPAPIARLRLLATTDVHMQFGGFDYVSDRQTAATGLQGIATLIDTARAEAAAENRACLLFDNGDLLQGTPMGRFLADQPVGADHPAVACMNQLRFDAVGLGNHDLDFGLRYTGAVAEALDMPVVASNLEAPEAAALSSFALLSCPLPQMPDSLLKVGVLSVMPQQTTIWNRHRLDGKAHVHDTVACLRRMLPQLRERGADVIVVLAHVGITNEEHAIGETALELACIPGIDALITGHTHRRFPGADHPCEEGVAADKGTLMQVPTIMPGHGGSDLGVLDLTLRQEVDGGWRVLGHVSSLRSNTPDTPRHAGVRAAVAPAHAALRHHLSTRIGHSSRHLHNYFTRVAPTPICRFSAHVVQTAVAAQMAPTRPPLLIATAAHTAGGREGPDHYLSIPQGDVLRRHLAGLNPYDNQIWVVQLTGAALLRRLEHAASVFAPSSGDGHRRMLHHPGVPAFNFETVFGITYQIHPDRPAGQRISGVQHGGRPVAPSDLFHLATDQFRAAGGAGAEPIAPSDVVLVITDLAEQTYAEALGGDDPVSWLQTPSWSFGNCNGTTYEIQTSPEAEACLDQIAHLSPEALGLDDAGFLRVSLTL